MLIKVRSINVMYDYFQAMIDTAAEHGWLASTLTVMHLLQMIIQARWIDEPAITTLPYINTEHLQLFLKCTPILPLLCKNMYNRYESLVKVLSSEFQEREIYEVI